MSTQRLVTGVAPVGKSRSGYQVEWRRNKKAKERASSSDQQHEAQELANIIKSTADRFPTLKVEVNEFLYLLHQRCHQSPDRVRDGVLHALKWAASVEDICEETQFGEPAIIKTLEALRALGVAEEVPRGRTNNDGGQPTVWRLTGKKSITPDVMP